MEVGFGGLKDKEETQAFCGVAAHRGTRMYGLQAMDALVARLSRFLDSCQALGSSQMSR